MAYDESELQRAKQIAKGETERRAEGVMEAERRDKVRAMLLGDFARLSAMLEPESVELENLENDATLRIEQGDTLADALAREVALAVGPASGPVSSRGVALRLLSSYDEDYALEVGLLPNDALTAERIYAHLVSHDSVVRAVPEYALAGIARRATVLLFNRRYMKKDAAPPPARVAPPEEPELEEIDLDDIPPPEGEPPLAVVMPDFCVECGRTSGSADPRCPACPDPEPPPAKARAPAPSPERTRPRQRVQRGSKDGPLAADADLVLDFTGAPRRFVELEPEAAHRAAEPRRVIGYARVIEDLTFATRDASTVTKRGADVVLRRGTVVEVMAPSEKDQKDIEKSRENGVQLVTIRWEGKARLVKGNVLGEAGEGEFSRVAVE